jgi:hypothetical protein
MMKSPQGGNLGDPRGIEMESEVMRDDTPMVKVRRGFEAWKRGLRRWNMVSRVVFLQKNARTPK